MTADVGFYVDLAHQADGPLVELAVGNGRVAIPVAQATGTEPPTAHAQSRYGATGVTSTILYCAST